MGQLESAVGSSAHKSPVVVAWNPLSAIFGRKDHWVDEALLHDGRTIDVARTVTWALYTEGHISQIANQPDRYAFTATNPDTGKTVRWAGASGEMPFVLDFQDRIAYLVLGVGETLSQYGCPEIPFVFFRHDDRTRKWVQIEANKFPRSLLNANLSLSHEAIWLKNKTRQTKEEIVRLNRTREDVYENAGPFVIPTDFASWTYRYKKQYSLGHYRDGCRHIVPQALNDPTHPQSPGQPSQEVSLEILDAAEYEPVRVVEMEARRKTSWDFEKEARCRALLKGSDAVELRDWVLFVNDVSGRKKARFKHLTFCNAKSIWFVDHLVEPGRVVLVKFSVAGDFIYRISFARPSEPWPEYTGFIRQPSFRDENGFLLFDWENSGPAGPSYWHIKRLLKARVREP